MFKNEFQGGASFEIFSAQGKDPTAQWKLIGVSGIKKCYERDVKGSVYCLEGSPATTKMSLPKDPRQSLTLVQRFLVFQMLVGKGQDLSIDLGVLDHGNSKRRIFLSTSHKETHVTPLHAKIPLAIMKRGMWLNLCFDMVSMVGETWKGQTYRSIDSISLSANCKLKKIFTLKSQPRDTTDDAELYGASVGSGSDIVDIPTSLQLPLDTNHQTQVLSLTKIKSAERLKSGTVMEPSSPMDLDLNASGRKSSLNESFRIAFGSKVPPAPNTSRKSARDGNLTNRSSKSGIFKNEDSGMDSAYQDESATTSKESISRQTSREGSGGKPPASREGSGGKSRKDISRIDKSRHQRHLSDPSSSSNYAESSTTDDLLLKPHPPREPSHERVRRRIRLKNSAGKDRQTNSAGSVKDESNLNISVASSNSDKYRSSSEYDIAGYEQNSDELQRRFKSVQHMISPEKRDASQRPNSSDVETSKDRMLNDEQVYVGKDSSQFEKHSSDNDQNETVDSVIELLKNRMEIRVNDEVDEKEEEEETSEDESDSPQIKEYEDSEEDDEEDVYLFAVPPKSGPRKKSPSQFDISERQAVGSSKSSLRKSVDRSMSRGAKPENDFVNSESSSDEESLLKVRKTGSRPNSDTRISSGNRSNNNSNNSIVPELSVNMSSSPKLRKSSPKINNREAAEQDYIPIEVAPPRMSGISPELSSKHQQSANSLMVNGGLSSNSVSRMNRKSLREIPNTDSRLSQAKSEKTYDFKKYQHDDISESFEARMFASMKKHHEEELENVRVTPRKSKHFTGKSPRLLNGEQRQVLDESPATTSDDDTSSSFWRRPAPNQVPHNYQDEMKLRMSSDTLGSSNPRDWSGVFSPPIVLPSEMQTIRVSDDLSSDRSSPRKPKTDVIVNSLQINGGISPSKPSREDELDLLYDPCLNCYFDPKTNKYYELV